ncbi:MAG: hypothetical protein WBF02_18830, partial [Xanthobacteraceae bacterium]
PGATLRGIVAKFLGVSFNIVRFGFHLTLRMAVVPTVPARFPFKFMRLREQTASCIVRPG